MNFKVKIDDNLISVHLVNKKAMKHCYLRIINKQVIQIRANNFFDINDAKKLLEDKKEWIKKALAKFEKNSLQDDEFLYFGTVQKLSSHKIKNLDKFYREEIEKYIPHFVEKYSKLMDLYPSEIKYRKNKRTWGSCNSKNALNFNILLVKYPIEIMEYIVIHELAHIKHKNHSKSFWNLVYKYCPNYKQIEKKFKEHLI